MPTSTAKSNAAANGKAAGKTKAKPVGAGPRERYIDVRHIYQISDFAERIGQKQDGMRTLRRAGLRVLRWGGRAYISGADWLDFLQRQHERKEQ